MKRITTVLFDFDGTLMDTNEIIIESWQHTFRTLTGKEGDVEQILESFGEILRDTVQRFFPGCDVEKTVEIYRSYQVSFYKKLIRMFPGMPELVDELKRKGYKLAVVTSRLRPTTEEGLEKYGLEHTFDYVVTADDTDKHKPDPEPALIALRKLNSRPEEAIMVGDTMYDMGCGKNAGVSTVMVNWAMAAGAQKKMSSFQPDFTIDRPEELWDVIAALDDQMACKAGDSVRK